MDEFDIALNRLRADERSLDALSRESGIPKETLRDIKSGHVTFPRINTMRKLATLYRTPAAA